MHHLQPSPFLFLLLILAASPRVATAATFNCVGGVYKANSTYEANVRRLAAVLPAETAASQGLQASRGVGYWPNRPRASSQCYWGVSTSSCAACVAGAFREAERACPRGKKAVVFARNCTLSLADFPRALGFARWHWYKRNDSLKSAVASSSRVFTRAPTPRVPIEEDEKTKKNLARFLQEVWRVNGSSVGVNRRCHGCWRESQIRRRVSVARCWASSRLEWFEFLLEFLRSKGVNSSKEGIMRNYRNLGEGLRNITPRESN